MFTPFLHHPRGDLFRIQGLDRAFIGPASLYLAGTAPAQHPGPVPLRPEDWLGSGTFRNSLYMDPWARFSRIRDVWLVLDIQGSVRARVMLACPGQPARQVGEFSVQADHRQRVAYAVATPDELPAGSRLFWHLDAVDEGAQLHEAAWCTRTPPRGQTSGAPLRLAVLMRTFGRAAELRSLLHRFSDAAAENPEYAELLARIDFWVLDATPGAATEWPAAPDLARLGLNLRLMTGPNLGGGGNASHLLARFLEASEAREPDALADELLILDDDLSLSMESLGRYLLSCAWRGNNSNEVIWSLPVLMKSRPSTLWEDGAFWGRHSLHDAPQPRGLGPQMRRHGLSLDSFDPLDSFGPVHPCDYATFIFFGLSLATLRRIGLPAAFFLRGDDVELSLRAAALGVPVLSNPNLAAWHEPAHSHTQEYMAILHGLLINLTHSADPAARYTHWFEQRMVEHSSLGDLAGLSLYLQVLEDLLNPDSALLREDFDTHYRERLPALAATRWAPLADGERERLHCEVATGQSLVLPFLYPGYHPHEGRQARVMLLDSQQRSVRELPRSSNAERLALMARMLAGLVVWERDFDSLRQHWCQRLEASGRLDFWLRVAHRHQAQTLTHVQLRPGQARSPAGSPAALATGSGPAPDEAEPDGLALAGHKGSAAHPGAYSGAHPGTHPSELPEAAFGIAGLVAPQAAPRPLPARPLRELRERLERELAQLNQLKPGPALDPATGQPSPPALVAPAAPLHATAASSGRNGHSANGAWWSWLRRGAQRSRSPKVVDTPEDFDARVYLALHADVARSGMDPVRHYTHYGHAEGRRYRP